VGAARVAAAVVAVLAVLVGVLVAVGGRGEPGGVVVEGRWFARADGTPLFWLADTAWGVVGSPSASQYLSARAEQGFTVVRTALVQTGDARAFRGHLGALDLSEGGYWDGVDDVVAAARTSGLTLALAPVSEAQVGSLLTEDNAREYGTFLGARYGDAEVVWLTGASDDPIWTELIRGLREGGNTAPIQHTTAPDPRESHPTARESDTTARESDTTARESDTGVRESDTPGRESDTSARESDTPPRESCTPGRESDTSARESDSGVRESCTPGRESDSGVREPGAELPRVGVRGPGLGPSGGVPPRLPAGCGAGPGPRGGPPPRGAPGPVPTTPGPGGRRRGGPAAVPLAPPGSWRVSAELGRSCTSVGGSSRSNQGSGGCSTGARMPSRARTSSVGSSARRAARERRPGAESSSATPTSPPTAKGGRPSPAVSAPGRRVYGAAILRSAEGQPVVRTGWGMERRAPAAPASRTRPLRAPR
jgi:hypothetical protein